MRVAEHVPSSDLLNDPAMLVTMVTEVSNTVEVNHVEPEQDTAVAEVVTPVAVATTASAAPSSEAPAKPRLCHMRTWPDWQGFGFNMHTEKNNPGQYIGEIDDGSPAQLAGLKQGDRIVEVNGENVIGQEHAAVVERIRAKPDETTLLVMDPDTYKYYDDRDIYVDSSMKDIILCCENPETRPIGMYTHSHTLTRGTHCSQVKVI